ncbi:DUF4304 domain-containing protein [Kribbella sp. NPDC051137]|uniref:DUF4304 domain-containing protein n=1 Tax=Kribbella sp. NPDC051137 TaxID=3155045 RepID=UPI00344620DC
MTAQEALKVALRNVLGPNARSHGYKGSAPTWRKSNASGDWAVVNVQSSSWSTAERLRCVVNLAVAPEPWLRWQRERLGAGMPKSVTEYLGLYRERLHPAEAPAGTDGWWEVRDAESAVSAATDIVAQLEHAWWPVLDRLLTPGGMLQQVGNGDLGYMKRPNHGVFFASAGALLRMDQGPSDALEADLQTALDFCMPEQKENAEQFDAWVREQARRGAS